MCKFLKRYPYLGKSPLFLSNSICYHDCWMFQELDDALVLIHEKKITSLNAIVKVLELALKVNFDLCM